MITISPLQQYGLNQIPAVEPKSFWRLAWEAFCDMVLIMLTVAGVILIIIYFIQSSQTSSGSASFCVVFFSKLYISVPSEGLQNITLVMNVTVPPGTETTTHAPSNERDGHGWIDGVAILVAVAIVVFITAGNDYAKEKQFRSLQSQIESDQKFTVIRGARSINIPVHDIVVGDICQVKYGSFAFD